MVCTTEGEREGFAKLLARLEDATGPDRELADDVLLACGWSFRIVHDTITGTERVWAKPGGTTYGYSRPDPLASLDAAISLVPEGYVININQACGPGRTDWSADVKKRTEYMTDPFHRGRSDFPAIALCIASLKARAKP